MKEHPFTRRAFLGATVGAALATTLAGNRVSAENGFPQVCVFTKHLQFLDYKETAKVCKEAGLDGVDIPVRRGGHVEPANIERDLPRAVEAFRNAGLAVGLISTDLCRGQGTDPRSILETASSLGIKYFRIGNHHYDKTREPFEQLNSFVEEARELARVAEDCGMTGTYHNHSGDHNVGGPLWDLLHIIRTVKSDSIMSNFDPGHARVEGAGGVWRTNMRLMAPYVRSMAVKDFVWRADGSVRWVPLGEGLVDLPAFLRTFREAGFAGPISMHFEYDEYHNASPQEKYEDIQKSAIVLRAALTKSEPASGVRV
jgi:sugar phosphate isomerase/epimerase